VAANQSKKNTRLISAEEMRTQKMYQIPTAFHHWK